MNVEHKDRDSMKYDSVLSAWREQLAKSANDPALKLRLLNHERDLLPRFAAQYDELRTLPRRARRAMQREWKRSLGGVALLMALAQAPAIAATINVGGACTLADAITAANTNVATGGCKAGSGADRIVLPSGSTQTVSTPSEPYCLLPSVESVITVAGNGSTIRPRNVSGFINDLCVFQGGNLILQRTTLTGADRGLFIDLSARAKLTNTTISRNKQEGVYNSGRLTVTNSTISGNSGSGLFGDFADNTVTNSTVSGNKDSGIELLGGNLTLTNSTISGNTASGRGGGIDNYMGDATLTNSTISGNSARSSGGGGVYNGNSELTVINSTITRNSAASGGGVLNGYYGDLTLSKALISGNTAPKGREVFMTPEADISNANDFNVFGFSGNAGVDGFTPGATDIVPSVALSKVLKTTLATNGGPTRTHALVSGSPAIDAVTDGTCPPPRTDQRGIKRPQDGNQDGGAACDVGAYELKR